MSEITTLISTLGFPIGSWIILAWYIYKVQGETNKALQANTRALLLLCDRLNISPEEVIDID